MVTRTDRAQLILAGALLLAAIIFGVSFLLSSVLYTGATGVGGADAAVTDTDRLADEVNQGARSLVVRVNHAQWGATPAEVAAAVEANVSRFSDLYAESKAASGSVAVDVAFENATSRLGYRLTQTDDAAFTDVDGHTNWIPIADDQDATLGWFTANVHVQNTSTDPVTIVASNDSGADIFLRLQRNNGNISVQSGTSSPPSDSTTCEPTGGRVLLDLYDGRGFNANCSFHGIELLGDRTDLEFVHADRIEGRFSIVADNRANPPLGTDYPRCTAGSASESDPCLHPVIWSANLSTTVRSDRVGYQNRYNLSIYPGAP
jgi:hypothetical protein